ncbi:MAG: twin-arginine translocation signal domain-containing protein [Gammaproteobacteria bacterium]|nr:twin-arginine translocation signal domain-containing protein [Gammaproteobacteria bacterium]
MSKHQREAQQSQSRRAFLRNSALAGGAAAVAAVTNGAMAVSESQESAVPLHDQPSKGYRETAHVREYYAKARF